MYIELHLLKKILKKLEEINLYIQMQGATLSLHAVLINVLVMFSFTIIGPNSSDTITDEIPEGYTEAFFYLSIALSAISFISFFASYNESQWLQRFSTLVCALTMMASVGLAIFNEIVSALILSRMASEEGSDTSEL